MIGFDEVRLAWALPGAPRTQLEQLWEAGALAARPPATPAAITDPDPRLQRIKRWVFGNCAHCHNGNGTVDLRPAVLVSNTVNRPTDASGITPPAGWLRVVPGDPERSVLFVQTRRTGLPPAGGLRPMPPVGVDLTAGAAPVENLRQWILGLRGR